MPCKRRRLYSSENYPGFRLSYCKSVIGRCCQAGRLSEFFSVLIVPINSKTIAVRIYGDQLKRSTAIICYICPSKKRVLPRNTDQPRRLTPANVKRALLVVFRPLLVRGIDGYAIVNWHTQAAICHFNNPRQCSWRKAKLLPKTMPLVPFRCFRLLAM